MLDELQFRLLTFLWPRSPGRLNESAGPQRGKLAQLLGAAALERIRGKTVLDFGCGEGWEVLEAVRAGARRAIGLDLRPEILARAQSHAQAAGLAEHCSFVTRCSEPVDLIISIDAFEHFAAPAGILAEMHRLLKPGGEVLVSFGPPWRHPLGGHTFSVFPWAHLLFSETALCRWRATFKSDGARRFEEVEGGLNQMTIARFERLVAQSGFALESLELVPIRALRKLHAFWSREFTTALVRCRLVKPASLSSP